MLEADDEKRALRSNLRSERASLDEAQWQRASAAICDLVLRLDRVSSARRIALFWPLLRRHEPDLRPLDRALRERGKLICYPNMRAPDGSTVSAPGSAGSSGAHWGFRQTTSADDLHSVGGLYEPLPTCPAVLPADLDVIIAPCLALDDAGYRLGYGAGFYDRVLLRFAPPAFVAGVCYASERQRALPRQVHDRAVDWIVTDAASHAVPNRAVPDAP